MTSGVLRRWIGALRNALPRWPLAIGGSLVWSSLMAASVAISLWSGARAVSPTSLSLVLLFALGGLIAFSPAVTLAHLFRARRFEVRFSATFFALAVTTVGVTASLYALQFRLYFSHWHGDPFTILWLFQLAFTVAAALYQFAVLGLRLFFPIGLIALFAVSAWLANRSR